MELSEKVENIGGTGYGGGAGCGLFLMAIFLVALFSLFRRREHDGHEGLGALACLGGLPNKEGCADKLTWARYANYIDPATVALHRDSLMQTGEIMKQQAIDTGILRSEINTQTRELLINQEKNSRDLERLSLGIARDQERAFFQVQLDGKNEKIAEGRERALMLEGRLLQTQSEREADRRQAELFAAMNAQAFGFKAQLDSIQCQMLTKPPFYPYGGVASINPCYGINTVGHGNVGSGCGSCG